MRRRGEPGVLKNEGAGPEAHACAVWLLALTSLLCAVGCSDAADYGDCADFHGFAVPVVPVSSVNSVLALGELDPPEDVVPAVGGGFKFSSAEDIAVTAPGDGVITRVTRSEYLVSPMRQGVKDYGLVFQVCEDIAVELAHLVELDATLLDELGSGDCEDLVGAEETVRDCTYAVRLDIVAGDPIGITGLYQNGEPTGLDFSATDRRVEPSWVNPDRIGDLEDYRHAICSYELFETEIADSYIALAASGLDPLMRATDPCGTTHVDVPGSAQGVWVRESSSATLEEDLPLDAPNFLTLSPDVADPANWQVISPGVAELQTLLITTPRLPAGRVNLDFAEIPEDGTLHCYEGASASAPGTHAFLLAVDAGVLTIERLVGTCSGDAPASWVFGAGAISFVR